MTTAPALRMRGLRCSFGPVVAVDGVDLDVDHGTLMAILGPSGCGKTTTLRLVAGFERPDSGTVELEGRAIAGPGLMVAPEHRRIGYVAQAQALFPHLDVRRNIGYGLRNMPDRAREGRVDELLELADLGAAGALMPHQLSGGMAQRVALCRALAPRPRIVLLDEPFSSLDRALRADLRDEVRALLRSSGQTAILVTHDQHEALSMADRIAVMHDGRIEQHATPEELHERPASRWVATFVGAGRLVPGRVMNGSGITPLGAIRLLEPVPLGASEILIRPEHLDLVGPDEGGTPAIITERRFEGSRVRLRLRTDAVDGLWADCPAALRHVRVGDHVGIRLRGDLGTVAFAG